MVLSVASATGDGALRDFKTQFEKFPMHPETAEAAPSRSMVLDWADDDLQESEIRCDHRSTRNGDLMATQTIQTILVAIVSAKGPGHPSVSTVIRKLVRTIAAANLLWWAMSRLKTANC